MLNSGTRWTHADNITHITTLTQCLTIILLTAITELRKEKLSPAMIMNFVVIVVLHAFLSAMRVQVYSMQSSEGSPPIRSLQSAALLAVGQLTAAI